MPLKGLLAVLPLSEASAAGLVDLLAAVSTACLGLVSKLLKKLLEGVASVASLASCVASLGFLLSRFVRGFPEGRASLAESTAALAASLALLGAALLNCVGFVASPLKGLLDGAASSAFPAAAFAVL